MPQMLLQVRRAAGTLAWALAVLPLAPLAAQSPPAPTPPATSPPATTPAATTSPATTPPVSAAEPPAAAAEPFQVEKLERLVEATLLDVLPDRYENTKRWGKTREVTTGLRIRRDGLNIKTYRRRSKVNHGTWTRYRVRPIDPERHLHLRLTRLAPVGPGRLELETVVDARLHLDARIAQWETGVQLFSVNASAIADVRLTLRGELGLKLDPANFPPDVVLDAEVTDADLVLRDFRLLQVSDLRGALAHQLGKQVRELVEAEIADRRSRIVQQMNRQIDKKKDDLRISLHDLTASKWKQLTEYAE